MAGAPRSGRVVEFEGLSRRRGGPSIFCYAGGMGGKVTGVFNILIGAAGIYMVSQKGAEFAVLPKPVGYAVCGILIVYGLYLLARKQNG